MIFRPETAGRAVAAALVIISLGCGGGTVDEPQEPVAGPEPPHTLMVAVVDLEGWSRDGQPAMYHGDELFELINGGAELYHQLGFRAAVAADYADPDGRSIALEVFEMNDATGAAELFVEKTGGTGEPAEIGDEAAVESYYLNARVDRYLITITGFESDDVTSAGIRALAEAVADALGGLT